MPFPPSFQPGALFYCFAGYSTEGRSSEGSRRILCGRPDGCARTPSGDQRGSNREKKGEQRAGGRGTSSFYIHPSFFSFRLSNALSSFFPPWPQPYSSPAGVVRCSTGRGCDPRAGGVLLQDIRLAGGCPVSSIAQDL